METELRELERKAFTGDVEAESGILKYRIRVGSLTRERLAFAASLGDPAALMLTKPIFISEEQQDTGFWWKEIVVNALIYIGPRSVILWLADVAEKVLLMSKESSKNIKTFTKLIVASRNLANNWKISYEKTAKRAANAAYNLYLKQKVFYASCYLIDAAIDLHRNFTFVGPYSTICTYNAMNVLRSAIDSANSMNFDIKPWILSSLIKYVYEL